MAALLPDPATFPVPPPPARGVSRRGLLAGIGAVLGAAAVSGAGLIAAGGARSGPAPATPAPPPGPARTRWRYATRGAVRGLAAGAGVVLAAGADAAVHAVDVGTGQARWTYALRAGARRITEAGDGAVVDDGSFVYALDAAGALRWEARGNLVAAGSGIVLAETLDDAADRRVTAFDAVTGEVRWHSPVDGPLGMVFALGNPGAAAGGRAHVGLSHALRTLDAANGTILWERPVPDLVSVVAEGSVVYATGGAPTAHSTLVAYEAASGRELWRRTVADRYGEPVVHEGTVYVDGGHGVGLSALDARTGEPRWELPRGALLTTAVYGTPPVVSGNTCYVGGVRIGRFDPGTFTLFAHATDTGEERFSVDLALDTGYTATIALVGDTVVLGAAGSGYGTGPGEVVAVG